ncbi:ornithine cyclodeaminase family protein [Ornithinibacillus halotolerans]|uniref:Ornithine cyclodeaminase n=1 Tax=Ornithinibacillus halotolerans TaxID=1274357 RepID=A0A916S166_9BACI|nr:ornithine cyclodeaminase family protein [Ornithinibacillus halotolerans]GGA79828.1 ornithine cyclodeaminase [Ornithinibacillus halotolerans]
MLIFSEKVIQSHYTMNDAIQDVKLGLISKKAGNISNPHRTVIDVPKVEGSVLYMPSADQTNNIAATKVVSIFPQNPSLAKPTTQGLIVLTEVETGEHICVMNASYLTRLRTGALSGIATEKLARKDAKVLGVIGTGGMALEQVLGVLEVRDIEEIKLFNRTAEKAIAFKEKLMQNGVAVTIEIFNQSEEVVTTSDIINCATRSYKPVFDGILLQPGTHINGVGSFLPTMREVDQTTIDRAGKIVVDDMVGVKEEAGELIHADANSDWSFSDIHAELSDIVNNDQLVRESDEEITFFKSVGAAYFDLVVAAGVYNKLKEKEIGLNIEI